MPKDSFIQASFGPPKRNAKKSPEEVLQSVSRAETLIPGDDEIATETLLANVSQKLDLAQVDDMPQQDTNEEQRGARKREALEKCGNIFVSYGPNDRVVFISPYTGFEMSKVNHQTLFDTYYKDTSLIIRKYYMTAEGDELGIHEDESGRVGWTWLASGSSKSSATRYSTLREWLAERQTESADIFLTMSISFGDPGVFWARCGIHYLMNKIPAALRQGINARKVKEEDLETKTKKSLPLLKVGAKYVALGAKETFFALYEDGSYQYRLHSDCRLVQVIRSHPEHVTTLTNIFFSPTDHKRYFLIADHGLRTLSITYPKLMQIGSRVDAHFEACVKEFPDQVRKILPESKSVISNNLSSTDEKHAGAQSSRVSVDKSAKGDGTKSKRRFSLFGRGGSASVKDVETVRKRQ